MRFGNRQKHSSRFDVHAPKHKHSADFLSAGVRQKGRHSFEENTHVFIHLNAHMGALKKKHRGGDTIRVLERISAHGGSVFVTRRNGHTNEFLHRTHTTTKWMLTKFRVRFLSFACDMPACNPGLFQMATTERGASSSSGDIISFLNLPD